MNNLKIKKKAKWEFIKTDLTDKNKLLDIFKTFNPDIVVNLAAQAGVRYSIENPQEYIQSNINGFFNILELSRHNNIKHLIFASSSSIYGENENLSFEESQITDTPKNLYAASKKSNELISYSYANLFKLPCTGLRFFTVYGPWGRPDMAYFKFVKNIYDGKPIEIYGQGKMYRDFTYIDEIIEGILKILQDEQFKTEMIDKGEKLYNSIDTEKEFDLLFNFIKQVRKIRQRWIF